MNANLGQRTSPYISIPQNGFQNSIKVKPNFHYKLPSVLENSKKPYADSFSSAPRQFYKNPLKDTNKLKPLKTLDTENIELTQKMKSRHFTQPRNHQRPVGFTNEYNSKAISGYREGR
jgi:hypothetical protein